MKAGALAQPHQPARFGFEPLCAATRYSGGSNVAGGWAFLTLLHLKGYLLTLGKGLEIGADDGAVVDKNILAAILPGDKAITFGFVKPLHCSCNQGTTSVNSVNN